MPQAPTPMRDTCNISFEEDRAIMRLECVVMRDGSLSQIGAGSGNYPAFQQLRALLPAVVAEMAPGYLKEAT